MDCPNRRFCAASIFLTALLACTISPASAQTRLTVDNNDPAIAAFRQQPVAAAPPGAAALDIPVLGLVTPPGTPAPAGPPPRLVSDPDRDRGWYALVYNRGDVKVTVTGDLNVQALADGTTLAVGPGDDINVASAEDSGDPVIAQMTLNRFPNIPYAVEVVCGTPVSAALCRSEPQLRGLLASIGLLSVPNR